MLQNRMTRAAARCIDGHVFSTVPSKDILEEVFEVSNAVMGPPLRMGPGLSRMLSKSQVEHLQGVGDYIAQLKVVINFSVQRHN